MDVRACDAGFGASLGCKDQGFHVCRYLYKRLWYIEVFAGSRNIGRSHLVTVGYIHISP